MYKSNSTEVHQCELCHIILPAADMSASTNCVTYQRLLSHLIYHKFDRLTFTENLCHYFRNSRRLYMICVIKEKHVESTL